MEGTRQAEYRKGKLRRGGVARPQSDAQTRRARRRRELAARRRAVRRRIDAEAAARRCRSSAASFWSCCCSAPTPTSCWPATCARSSRRSSARCARTSPALVAFSLAFVIVLLGGSALTFVVKGGTVVAARRRGSAGRADRAAAAAAARRAARQRRRRSSRSSTAASGCGGATCGSAPACCGVYGATAAVYLGFVVGGYHLVENTGVLLGWTIATALASSVLIVWITLVNFFYLLTQMVDRGRGRRRAQRRAPRRARSSAAPARDRRRSSASCCCSAVIATVASILATAGLRADRRSIPLVGLAVLPLQVAAWLLRGFVFQYLALAALGAYLTHYRHYLRGTRAVRVPRRPRRGRFRDNGSHDRTTTGFSPAPPSEMQESAIRRMGTVLAQKRDIISFAPGYPAPETFPWDEFQEIARELLAGTRRRACCSTDRRAATGRCSRRSPASWSSAASPTALERLLVTTGSQQGLDLVARVLLDPGDVVLVELPTYTGAITAFRNVQAQHGRRAAGGRRHRPRRARRDVRAPRRREGRRVRFLYVVPNFQNPTGLLIGLEQAPRAARVGRAPRRADRRGRSVPRAVLRGLGDRSGRAADQGGRREAARHLSEQLLEDAGAGIPRRLDRRAGAARREARDGQAGGGPAAPAASISGWSTRRAAAASSQRQLPLLRRHYQQKRDVMVEALRAAFGDDGHLAGAARRVLPLGDAAAPASTPSALIAARDRSRRHLRRRRGVLRQRRRPESRCGCRSRRRRRSGSARASRGSPRRFARSSARASQARRQDRHRHTGQRRKRLNRDRRDDRRRLQRHHPLVLEPAGDRRWPRRGRPAAS